MMSFATEFLQHSLVGIGASLLWFGIPGWLCLRLLRVEPHPLGWLAAPALGLGAFGGFSLWFAFVFGHTAPLLVLAWLLFCGAIWLLETQREDPPPTPWTGEVSPGWALGLTLGAAAWALIPSLMIYPVVHDGGLFTSVVIFDHAKVAMTDAIAREGMLPLNPYYAPEGERIPLIYYYAWHFMASQFKLLLGVSGWAIEFAMTWLTAFAALGFLLFLVVYVAKTARAGGWLLLFALCGPVMDLIAWLPPPLRTGLLPPDPHIEVLWLQAAWVPQHVLSALMVVVIIFLLARLLAHAPRPHVHAALIGLLAATGFGASTWVGGIGLGMALPAFVLAVMKLRLPLARYWELGQLFALALLVCVVAAMPLLISQASGPSLTESRLPFGSWVYPSTPLFENHSWGRLAHVVFFWIQLLPATLGIVYLAGMFGMFARVHTRDALERAFWALSLAGVIGHLLVAQFAHSTFWNNTFGWRVVLVPVMLLLVWSAIALTELSTGGERWRGWARSPRVRKTLSILATVGLTLGIFITLRVFHPPTPGYEPPSAEELALRRGFLEQRAVWAKVRELTGPTDLVQANPDGYLDLTPWPATLPYALFADRPTAYANREYATVFAYRYDPDVNEQQRARARELFSAHASPETIRYFHSILKVKAIVVDALDPAWHSDALAQSGLYRVAFESPRARIFLRAAPER